MNTITTELNPPIISAIELFEELENIKCHMRPYMNNHELVDLLIETCIESKHNLGLQIVGAVMRTGFDKRHVGIRLYYGTGENPARFRWRKDEAGFYQNLQRSFGDCTIVVPKPKQPSLPPPPPRVSAKDVQFGDNDTPPF